MRSKSTFLTVLCLLLVLAGSLIANANQDLGLLPDKKAPTYGQDFSYQFWLIPDISDQTFRLELARRIAMDGFFNQFSPTPQLWPLVEEISWDADSNIAKFSMTLGMIQGSIVIEFTDPEGLPEPFGIYIAHAQNTGWGSSAYYRYTSGIVTKDRLKVWNRFEW